MNNDSESDKDNVKMFLKDISDSLEKDILNPKQLQRVKEFKKIYNYLNKIDLIEYESVLDNNLINMNKDTDILKFILVSFFMYNIVQYTNLKT